MFEISIGKGKAGKPVTPSKASKEVDKQTEKEEDPAVAEPSVVEDQPGNNNNSTIDEDELIIKDDIDNDCFEEVDRIGEIEKEVNEPLLCYHSMKFIQIIFKDEEEHEQAKSNVVEEIKADDNIEITNNDNDDSINLTIGEEDEQLFEENDIKPKGNLRNAG